MSQSNRIFAFLAGAFLIFITMRGELRTYYGFIIGCGGSNANSNAAPATAPVQTGSIDTGQATAAVAQSLPAILAAFA